MTTAEAVYLPERIKIGAGIKYQSSSEVQHGDTELDYRLNRAPLARRIWTFTWVVDSARAVERMYEVAQNTTSFLFRPPADRTNDYRETGQALRNTVTGLLVGDGTTATFQLQITRTLGNKSGSKNILHPRTGTVKVYVATVEKTITTQWTVSLTTGIVTFTAGNIPTAGQPPTADFDYDTAVSFLSVDLETIIVQSGEGGLQEECRQGSIIEQFNE